MKGYWKVPFHFEWKTDRSLSGFLNKCFCDFDTTVFFKIIIRFLEIYLYLWFFFDLLSGYDINDRSH